MDVVGQVVWLKWDSGLVFVFTDNDQAENLYQEFGADFCLKYIFFTLYTCYTIGAHQIHTLVNINHTRSRKGPAVIIEADYLVDLLFKVFMGPYYRLVLTALSERIKVHLSFSTQFLGGGGVLLRASHTSLPSH